MRRYQALTSSRGPVDIGEYPDLNTARTFALQEYGADLQDVIDITGSIVVNTSAPDLGWLLVAAMGLAILALAENKKRKRRHVRSRR